VGAGGAKVFASSNPGGGASSWSEVAVNPGHNHVINGVSCPSSGLCVLATEGGRVVTSTDPFARTPTWTTQLSTNRTLDGVQCASTTLCMAFGIGLTPDYFTYGSIFVSHDPTGDKAAWHPSQPDRGGTSGRSATIAGMSCQPRTTDCVAVDTGGDVLVAH
jgi:hypothetical protein